MIDKALVVFTGDEHIGSTTGLMPEDGITLKDGNVLLPNPVQAEIAKYWKTCWKDVRAEMIPLRRKGFKLVVIKTADVIEGQHHESSQIWGTPMDHLAVAETMYKPVRDLAGFMFGVTGTAVHVGNEGEADVALAIRLCFDRYNGNICPDKLRLNIAGVRGDIAHHGPSVGKTPATFGNMPRNYAKTIVQNDLNENIKPPRFIVRGHVHKKCHEQVEVGKYLCDIFIIPSWKAKDEYAKKVTHVEHLADVGLLAMAIEKGKITHWEYRLHQWNEAPERIL